MVIVVVFYFGQSYAEGADNVDCHNNVGSEITQSGITRSSIYSIKH